MQLHVTTGARLLGLYEWTVPDEVTCESEHFRARECSVLTSYHLQHTFDVHCACHGHASSDLLHRRSVPVIRLVDLRGRTDIVAFIIDPHLLVQGKAVQHDNVELSV